MSEKLTPLEWLTKAEYEGGLLGAFEYGLNPYDLDDSDPALKAYLREVYVAWGAIDEEPYIEAVERYGAEC